MIKTLLKCVREYKKPTILTPVFMSIEVIFNVLTPFFMGLLITYGIDKGDMNYILKMGGILALTCIGSLASGILAAKTGAVASCGFAKNLRHDMFHNIQSFSFKNIDKFSTSSIVTRLTTDVTNVQNAFLMVLKIAIRAPLMFIFAIVMSIIICPELAAIFLITLPILGVGLFLIIKNAFPIFDKVFKVYDSLNKIVSENLHGIRVVKSFVREKHEEKKFTEVSDRIYNMFVKVEKIIALNNPLMQFCSYLSILLISWFAAQMIVGGTMKVGNLTVMINYATQILMNLMMVSMVSVMLIMAKASATRITEVLDEKASITNPTNPVMQVENGDIDFSNVGFSYSDDPNKLILSNVNLRIKSGSTYGILGSTGSSKSTLIQLISRLYDPTVGTVKVGNIDVKEYDLKTLRDAVAVVLQKNVLFSGTIKDNLRWGNQNATDEELARVSKLAQADGFIKEFPQGYDTYIEQGGTNVSGGQKQRLCIARALLKDPKILILDDSTSAVDTKTDALIRNAFLNEIPNVTKLIISQRISSIQDADKIIVMDLGNVIDIGSHEELLTRCDMYKEIYDTQNKGGKMNG